jgi:predicted AAA+ superfamily ATPase
MYTRLCNPLKNNSFFLFGARGTGKSSLLQSTLASESLWIDLLDDQEFLALSRRPSILSERLKAYETSHGKLPRWVVIDEVQRVPKILNEVHRLMEGAYNSQKLRFALTGSSARKLRRGSANMLGGRALVNNLYPLTTQELGQDADLDTALNWGTLPMVYQQKDDESRRELLKSYCTTYLREEIREEQIVRSLDPFIRFLEVAAQCSGKILNFSEIGRDCSVNQKAVQRYFQILEDTLLGVSLPAYHRSVRKQQRSSSKFYFFDLGVQRALQNLLHIPLVEQSYGYGNAFEQFIFLELYRLNSYHRKDFSFSYMRTKDNAEIDLVVERPQQTTLLIEVKSTKMVTDVVVNKLEALARDFGEPCQSMIFSRDPHARKVGSVTIYPWSEGINQLFA